MILFPNWPASSRTRSQSCHQWFLLRYQPKNLNLHPVCIIGVLQLQIEVPKDGRKDQPQFRISKVGSNTVPWSDIEGIHDSTVIVRISIVFMQPPLGHEMVGIFPGSRVASSSPVVHAHQSICRYPFAIDHIPTCISDSPCRFGSRRPQPESFGYHSIEIFEGVDVGQSNLAWGQNLRPDLVQQCHCQRRSSPT